MEPEGRGCSLKAILIVIALVASCGSITTFAIDSVCYSSLSRRLPIYPEATIAFERHSFFRRYGIGDTLVILETVDPTNVVRDWYGRTIGAAGQAARQSDDVFYYFARAVWSVTTAEDGTGSQIILSGVCAQ